MTTTLGSNGDNDDGPRITSLTYSGHKGPVLCLDVTTPFSSTSTSSSSSSLSSTTSLLLSGSEDKTARIWDLRDQDSSSSNENSRGGGRRRRPRAGLCIPTQGEVLSAVFSTSSSLSSSSSTTSSGVCDYSIFLGVNNTVLEYDLRHYARPVVTTATAAGANDFATTTNASCWQFKSPIWTDPPTRNLSKVLQNQDEVNQISTMYYPRRWSVTTRPNTLTSISQSSTSGMNNHTGGGGKKKRNNNNNNNKKNSKNRNKKKGLSEQQQKGDEVAAVEEEHPSSFLLASCDDSGTIRLMDTTIAEPTAKQIHDDDYHHHERDSSDNGNNDVDNNETNNDHSNPCRVLYHDPEEVAVVSCCSFRPAYNHNNNNNNDDDNNGTCTPIQLVSGGLDCKLHLWDLSTSASTSHSPLKPICSKDMNVVTSFEQQQQKNGRKGTGRNKGKKTPSSTTTNNPTSSSQAVNPPMVHSVCWNPSGSHVVAGLGSGNINIYSSPPAPTLSSRNKNYQQQYTTTKIRPSFGGNTNDNNLVHIGQLSYGHNSSVVSVVYPEFGGHHHDQSLLLSDRILCSAGSDGKIFIWDVRPCSMNEEAEEEDLDAILANINDDSVSKHVSQDKSNDDDVSELLTLFPKSLLLTDNDDDHDDRGRDYQTNSLCPRLLFQIDHKEKINWVSKATSASGTESRDTIFVADTSNDITSYHIPLLI